MEHDRHDASPGRLRNHRTSLDTGDLRRRRARRHEPGTGRRDARPSPSGASTTSTPRRRYGASEDRAAARGSPTTATRSSSPPRPASARVTGARAELERSLERMGVDHVDLIQLHNLVEPDEWEVAHGPGGAVEALVAGPRRGPRPPHRRHRPRPAHRRDAPAQPRALRRSTRCCCPYNYVAARRTRTTAADVEALLERVRRTRRRGPDDQGDRPAALARRRPGRRFSWYEPLTDPAAIARAVRYVLSDPRLFLNTTSDARLLPPIIDAATGDLDRPTDDELARRRRRPTASPRCSTTKPWNGSDLLRGA